ncbi:putative serine esterase-domain-containing protein [Linnemannia elongata]|nr:putative serine esterase-domain-containing protein [Linnemannia elongata]
MSATTTPITVAQASQQESQQEGRHLLVLNHGLWGNAGHVKFIADQFKERLGDRLLVYCAEANESKFTYDGVDICAQRLVQEIHKVIEVIESGGDIEDLKGHKHKKHGKKESKNKKQKHGKPNKSSSVTANSSSNTPLSSNPSSASSSSSSLHSHINTNPDATESSKSRKVTQFSFLGYSLGGLIGRFAMGLLDMEKFFDPVEQGGRGIEPVYFVTMATPHLGIRKPPQSNSAKVFNYLSSRMLSRTGEQLQLIDDYVNGKPILLAMSEPESIFIRALNRFKRRAIYCNVRNDRSVPFWTASFSDADPFIELESLQIQYSSGYSSVIESYEPHDLEMLAQLQDERAAAQKEMPLSEKISNINWSRYGLYALIPVLAPLWIIFASTTISYQGIDSRRRTKDMVDANETLNRIRERASTTNLAQYRDDDHNEENQSDQQQQPRLQRRHSTITVQRETGETSTIVEEGTSYSFPHLKSIKPLPLLPVQVEMSKLLNQLEWKKVIIDIDGMNAHASIVVREKRFANDGGVAAVQHLVDMFKGDGEDA